MKRSLSNGSMLHCRGWRGLIIDLRYEGDPNYRTNRAFLERVRADRNGKTSIMRLLELCGILSFNLNRRQLGNLFHYFPMRYSVNIFPEDYLTLATLQVGIHQLNGMISRKLSFGDALLLQHIRNPSRSILSHSRTMFWETLPRRKEYPKQRSSGKVSIGI